MLVCLKKAEIPKATAAVAKIQCLLEQVCDLETTFGRLTVSLRT